MSDKCKKTVFRDIGFFNEGRCTRNVWRDGWCKQHHPDSVRARKEKSDKLYEEKKKQQDWYKLQEAEKRISELEKELNNARKMIKALCDRNNDDDDDDNCQTEFLTGPDSEFDAGGTL